MGFYNYYRLLKEIRFLFRNKKIKKFLTIIIIFIIVLLILHNKGYCATDYNIFPPYHNNNNYVEMQLLSIPVASLGFDLNNHKLITTSGNRYGGYFELEPGWQYFIINNSGIGFNYCYLNETPAAGVTFTSPFTSNTAQTYYSISSNAGGGYCYYYTDDPNAVYTIYAYCSTSLFPLDKNSGSFYLTNIYERIKSFSIANNGVLTDIRDNLFSYLYGDGTKTEYNISSNTSNGLSINANYEIFSYSNSILYYFPVKTGYNYKFKINSSSEGNPIVRGAFYVSLPVSGLSGERYYNSTQNNIDITLDYSASKDGYMAFCFRDMVNSSYSITCLSNYNEAQELGLASSITNNNDKNTSIIDNTITNSNIEVNENQLVTDNTEDITENGYDNIFDMIKNAFTGTPQSITFPFSFLGNGQNLVLQPNFLSNGLQTAGLGMVVTIVNAYWYFVVCRFIVKKIHEIIEAFKEGELEHTTGNIKTEVF